MTATNATTARKNLYPLISDVNENRMPVTITNARGKNAVLLSEEDWNAMQETRYLSGNLSRRINTQHRLVSPVYENVQGYTAPLGERYVGSSS